MNSLGPLLPEFQDEKAQFIFWSFYNQRWIFDFRITPLLLTDGVGPCALYGMNIMEEGSILNMRGCEGLSNQAINYIV